MAELTRNEAMVLYQISAGISDPDEIADILPEQGPDDVRKALHGLKEKGLVRAEKRKNLPTHKGEEALKAHHRKAIGL